MPNTLYKGMMLGKRSQVLKRTNTMISCTYMKFKNQQNEMLVIEDNMVVTGLRDDWEGYKGAL